MLTGDEVKLNDNSALARADVQSIQIDKHQSY